MGRRTVARDAHRAAGKAERQRAGDQIPVHKSLQIDRRDYHANRPGAETARLRPASGARRRAVRHPRRAYGMIERAAGAMRPYLAAAPLAAGRAGTEIHGDPILISFMKHTLSPPASWAPRWAPAPRPPRYPLKDFFRNPERGYFRLSEDGKTLGFMQPASTDGSPARMNIFVQPLDGSALVGEPRKLTSETARDISNFFWKGPDVVLYQKDFGGDENFHVLAVDARTGKVTDLTPYDNVRASIIDDLEDDPDHVLVTHNQRDPQVFDVYRVNVRSGAAELVARNPGNIVGWQTDHAGRAAVASDGLNTTLLYRDDEGRRIPAADHHRLPHQRPSGLLHLRRQEALRPIQPRPRQAGAGCHRPGQARCRGRNLRAAGSRPGRGRLLAQTPRADPGRLPDRQAAVQVLRRPDRNAVQEADGQAAHTTPPCRGRTAMRTSSSSPPTTTARRARGYLYDAASDTLSKLADLNPSPPESGMARVQPISYQSRDGLTIHGYLTLPAGRDPKNLACIVNPHGGPWARDGWGYNPEVQFLANRGFCVLQMNFRGSTGYGRRSGSRLRPVGPEDAGRHQRWRGLAGQAGHRRSQARRHLRRQLRRLRHAGRRDLHARPVRGGGGLRGRVQPVHLHADHPALLETDAGQDAGHGGRPRARQGPPGRDLAGAARGPHQDAAVRGPGRQDPRVNRTKATRWSRR